MIRLPKSIIMPFLNTHLRLRDVQAVVYPLYFASFMVLVCACAPFFHFRLHRPPRSPCQSRAVCLTVLSTRAPLCDTHPHLQTVGLYNRPETNLKTWATDEARRWPWPCRQR